MSDTSVIRIKPYHYIHVLDNNSNVTRVELGPQTFTRQDHEKIVSGPDPMIMIPPRNYCIISNPIVTDKDGKPVLDSHGQVRLKHGDEQIRFEQDPFPLFPGEKLVGKVSPLQVVAPNAALRLRAIRDFGPDATSKSKHLAGDEWLFEGPGTYYPRVEVQVVEIIRAALIKPNEALKLRARKACLDRNNQERKAGEEWLIRKSGSYLPGVDEEVVDQVKSYILTDRKALHLKATRTFTDVFGKERKAGEEWLVTAKDAETHIPDVYEQVVGEVKITTLTNRQYCVVLDPIGANGKPQLGQKLLKKGETSFFLQPGESLEKGIQDVQVLGEEEALLLRAKESFTSGTEKHQPGDRWMIYGPCDYVPPTQVEIVERRKSIPLDENEGIYVRDIKTGEVKSELGSQSYLLKPNEELWPKELPKAVEELLLKERTEAEQLNAGEGRDKTRVVTYRAPHNSAVQIYDYKNKKSRVVFGPELVMLGPDEHFTVLSLSGDKPKRPHQIKSLALQLGPDFMTDVVIVETADHARLSLKLSYNWHFKVNKSSIEDATKIFQVPDFVGDSCKAIASRVRGTVASVSFDNFHKNSAKIIRMAVFGEKDAEAPAPVQQVTQKGAKGAETTAAVPATSSSSRNFFFHSNNLTITNIDIQSVEPVDQRTRDSLQKSVQLAIEITTKSQEAAARHEAERMEQGARGRLERQKINDEAEAENARRELLSLQAASAIVASTGEATAEAKARAESAAIEGEAAVKQAQLKAEATKIKSESELTTQKLNQEAEIGHQKALNDLELNKARELATIEAQKFNALVKAIGTETIKSIAQAGPEMQGKLLQGLGLKSFMITDGKSPINLFSAANGLIAPMNPAGSQ